MISWRCSELPHCFSRQAGQGRKAPASAAAGKAGGRLIPSLAKAAIKNWLLTLLLFICTLSGIFVFMEVLADIREGFL